MNIRERRPLTPEPPKPDRSPSIFDYYRVANEVEFTKNSTVSEEDAAFYVRENVHRFLGEFAGQVPYTHLAYTLQDNRLAYRGIDLTESYERVSGNSGREYDEYLGYMQIQNAFAKGAGAALWISPPQTSDYGFVFYFKRDEHDSNHINEYVLRYEEPVGRLHISQNILDRLGADITMQNGSEFLQNPLISTSSHLDMQDLSTILSAVGIGEDKIHKSQWFEGRIRDELGGWIDLYTSAVLSGDISSAETLLLAIYNRAYDMRSEIERRPTFWRPPLEAASIAHYASKKNPVSSGSCPVTQNNFGDPFSPTSITEKLIAGNSINGIVSEAQHFTCPNCEHRADGPVGNQCPGCNITREEWAEKGNKVC